MTVSEDAKLQTESDSALTYVTIVIGGQLFAVNVAKIQDVFTPQAITHVPLAPPEVSGVLNLRGRIVTLIDLRARLGLSEAMRQTPPMAVGVERGEESYGLLIDEIGEVITIARGDLAPVPETLDPRWRAVSKGVYRLQDRLLVALDLDRLMAFERSPRAA